MKSLFNTQKKRYRVALLVVCAVLLMPLTFAQQVETGQPVCSEGVKNFITGLYQIEGIASWIWIILGNFVGTLMTNSLVYGEVIGLDSFLWKIWQMTRNIANFTIGFFFLYALLRYMISPDSKKTPISMIKNMLISSVLIQASWFLVMVLVDLSTILFATVASFPSQVIADSTMLQQGAVTSFLQTTALPSEWKTVLDTLNSKIIKLNIGAPKDEQTTNNISLETVPTTRIQGQQITQEHLLDMLMPQANSLKGPFMYFGFTIFKTMNMWTSQRGEVVAQQGVHCVDTLFKNIVGVLLSSGMMIMYTLALLVLAIVLIGRLMYLWIFIAISPIVFLLKYQDTLKAPKDMIFLDIEKMINLIFQPVKFAGLIGIMMIVNIVVQAVFLRGTTPQQMWWAFTITTTSDSSILEVGNMLKVTLYQANMTFNDILIGVLTLVLMRMLVKMAITTKTGIKWLDSLTQKIADTAQKTIDYMPIVPTWYGNIGLANANPSKLLDTMTYQAGQVLNKHEDEQREELQRLLGAATNEGLTKQQAAILDKIAQKGNFDEYRSELASYRKDRKVKFSELQSTLASTLANSTKINTGFFKDQYLTSLFSAATGNTDRFKNAFKRIEGKSASEIEKEIKDNNELFQAVYRLVFGTVPTGSYEANKDRFHE